jgi:hypothetical protein
VTLTVTNADGAVSKSQQVVTVRPQIPSATINGPTVVYASEQASWSVTSSDAVRGTWSLPGVNVNQPNWLPGNGFGGSINVPGTYTLSLRVFNSLEEQSTASLTFSVVCRPEQACN